MQDSATRTRRWRARIVLAAALLPGVLRGAADAAAPRLVVAQPIRDFGTVEQGTPVMHAFVVANRGDATLHLEHVKSSCGCTVAMASAGDVPPDGEARIVVTFDTSRVAGRTTKVLTLYSDDPQAPVAALTLTGDVLTDLVLTPAPVYLGRVRRGDPVRREVIVRPGRPGGSAVVRAVGGEHPGLRTELGPPAEGGQRLLIELEPEVPLGRFHEELTLETTSGRQPVITLPVFGSIEGDVLVLPPQVSFGVARPGKAPERLLFIRNRGQRPLSVRKVAVPDSVDYDLRVIEEGLEYELALRLRRDVRPGKVKGEIEIFTDHPTEHRLVVPLYAVVRG